MTNSHGGKRKNAGRPKTGRVKVGYTITPESFEMLDKMSVDYLKSKGEVLDLAISVLFTWGKEGPQV